MKKNKKTENEIKKNVNSSENKSQLSLSPGYQINGGVRGHKYNTTWLPTDARKLDQIRVSVSAPIWRACKLANWTIEQSGDTASCQNNYAYKAINKYKRLRRLPRYRSWPGWQLVSLGSCPLECHT